MQIKDTPSHSCLDTVKNEYDNRDYLVKISIPEFSCVCPRTSLPDYAIIDIHYIPNKKIIELKSLKLYIVKYRSFGVFHEYVVNKILDDIKIVCRPKKIEVVGKFNPRGGIYTCVESSWP